MRKPRVRARAVSQIMLKAITGLYASGGAGGDGGDSRGGGGDVL